VRQGVSYLYDTVANGKGHLSSTTNGISVTAYDSYDQMGRVTASTQTTGSQSYTMAYAYDLAGHLTSQVYPSGRTVTTAYDSAGRLQSINGEQMGEQSKTYADSFSYLSPFGSCFQLI
jgi:YD repeat-containing protein